MSENEKMVIKACPRCGKLDSLEIQEAEYCGSVVGYYMECDPELGGCGIRDQTCRSPMNVIRAWCDMPLRDYDEEEPTETGKGEI